MENDHQAKEKQTTANLKAANLGHEERHRKHLTLHGNMTPEKVRLGTDIAVDANLGFQKAQGSFLMNVRDP